MIRMKKPTEHIYSDAFYNQSIAILGIMPPPLGGVSVHIKRVMHKLEKQNNKVFFFNTEQRRSFNFVLSYAIRFIMWLLKHKPDVIMYHSIYLANSYVDMVIITLYCIWYNKQIIYIEHDCRHMYQRSFLIKKLFSMIINRSNTLVLIGSKTYQSYGDNGIMLPAQITVESAFLAPHGNDYEIIIKTYPSSLWNFIDHHKPCMLVNASQLLLIDHTQDLYGINMSLRLLKRMRQYHPSLGLIIALAQPGNKDYYNCLLRYIYKQELTRHIFMLDGQKELWPLFTHIDLFVRPTLSDGASVSIEEALYYNVPVVASDVCCRPERAYIFKSADDDDFARVVQLVLQGKKYEAAFNEPYYLYQKSSE